jgi:hypothetical protein
MTEHESDEHTAARKEKAAVALGQRSHEVSLENTETIGWRSNKPNRSARRDAIHRAGIARRRGACRSTTAVRSISKKTSLPTSSWTRLRME